MRQNWLLRVARYIDQSNITEIFEESLTQEKSISPNSSNIMRLHLGRLNATSYFFRSPEIKKNRKLWDSVKALSDYYRGFLSHSLMIEVLRKELKEAELKGVEMRQSIDGQISKVAFSYTTLENPSFRPEMIISQTEVVDSKMRDAIILNCKLVRYIFCTDTVLDHNNEDLKVIIAESLELKVGQKDTGNSTPRPPPSMRQPNMKHTPSKMDAERRMDQDK